MGILKWLSLEVGISQKIIIEARKNRTIKNYSLLGPIQSELLQPKLDKFISDWVLCGTCENPETLLWRSEKNFISQRCYACGQLTILKNKKEVIEYFEFLQRKVIF